jgi:hypothetical protein
MPRNPSTGRFSKVTIIPQAGGPSPKRSYGGNLNIQVRSNAKEIVEVVSDLRTRVGSTIIADADQRAAVIQQRLRAAVLGAYNKASTGRLGRGIFAKALKTGTADGGVQTVIRVTMFNYREANFLTNLGGRGYFQRFPVGPYRIFAQGVEGALSLLAPFRKKNSLRSSRKTLSIVKQHGVGRLKVPRRSSFFTAGRAQGRGGGESRIIGDTLGPAGDDRASHFFFYPLWVNHPGFAEDVISAVALEEGARFTTEIRDRVAAVSTDIPVPVTSVTLKSGRRIQ